MSFLKSEWAAMQDVVCALGVVVVNKSGRIRDKSSLGRGQVEPSRAGG
jgi:hypothetical protein